MILFFIFVNIWDAGVLMDIIYLYILYHKKKTKNIGFYRQWICELSMATVYARSLDRDWFAGGIVLSYGFYIWRVFFLFVCLNKKIISSTRNCIILCLQSCFLMLRFIWILHSRVAGSNSMSNRVKLMLWRSLWLHNV